MRDSKRFPVQSANPVRESNPRNTLGCTIEGECTYVHVKMILLGTNQCNKLQPLFKDITTTIGGLQPPSPFLSATYEFAFVCNMGMRVCVRACVRACVCVCVTPRILYVCQVLIVLVNLCNSSILTELIIMMGMFLVMKRA